MIQGIGNLLSSVQVLNLSQGLYLVSVSAGAPQRVGDKGSLALPAIHIGPAPGCSADGLEFMAGPRHAGHWLFENRDTLIVKVMAEQAMVVLTTLRGQAMPAVEVEVSRLDREAPIAPAAPAVAALPPGPPSRSDVEHPIPPPLKTVSGQVAVSVRVDLHLARKGDVTYTNTFWSGALGERCAIEGFAIQPLADLRSDQIEYSAVAENGRETGWVTGGALCGSHGRGLALSGFAIRIRPEAQARFKCEYRGAFASRRIVGPASNGALCGADPADKLEAIQLFILRKESQATAVSPPAPADPALPPPARVIGPRFSVFRETAE
jgi:hypothetical protein